MKNLSIFFTLNSFIFIVAVASLWIGFEHQDISLVQGIAFVIGFCDCFGYALAISIASKWN
jgi:hypothetical protein